MHDWQQKSFLMYPPAPLLDITLFQLFSGSSRPQTKHFFASLKGCDGIGSSNSNSRSRRITLTILPVEALFSLSHVCQVILAV